MICSSDNSFKELVSRNRAIIMGVAMILVVLYPTYDNYFTIKLSNYREKEVKEIIEIHDRMLK